MTAAVARSTPTDLEAWRALVEVALERAEGRAVRVVTFGTGHPADTEAESARHASRTLGFAPVDEPPGPASDATPREILVHPGATRTDVR